MKKNMLFFFLLMFISGAAFSQISLRPQIGINFPSFTDEIASFEFEGNVGYQFGADLQIGGRLYVQPGLNFQSTTFDIKDVTDGELKVSRLNIPVYVGFRFFEGEDATFGLRAFAGPNFAINVNEELSGSLGELNEDNIRGSLIAGVAGAGLDFSILFVDIAYKFGLTEIFEDLENADAKKNFFLVNAGVRIGF